MDTLNKATNNFTRVLSIVVSLVAGFFILFNGINISADQAFGYGILAFLLGVIYAGTPKPSMPGVFGLITLGIYAMARATGKIDVQILRYAVGLPLVAIGLWGVYSMLNHQPESKDKTHTKDQPEKEA